MEEIFAEISRKFRWKMLNWALASKWSLNCCQLLGDRFQIVRKMPRFLGANRIKNSAKTGFQLNFVVSLFASSSYSLTMLPNQEADDWIRFLQNEISLFSKECLNRTCLIMQIICVFSVFWICQWMAGIGTENNACHLGQAFSLAPK